MKKLNLPVTFIAIGALLIFSMQSMATVWRINNEPNNRFIQSTALNGSACNHCFSDINVALQSLQVSDYDTLHIEATPYDYGIVNVDRPITLIGAGYFLLPAQNGGLQFNTQNSTLAGLAITGGAHGSHFIGLSLPFQNFTSYIDADSVTIERCAFFALAFGNNVPRTNITITQCYGGNLGQSAPGNASINNLIVTNNYLTIAGFFQHVGIFSNNVVQVEVNGYSGMTYENNIIIQGSILENGSNSVANVRNNTFSPGTYWFNGVPGNTNETELMSTVFANPSFTYDADLQTNPVTCLTCNHGFPWPNGTGTLKGVFGGTTPYVLGGIANIPTIYNLNAFSPINQGGNTPVNVSTRSNNKN